MTTKTYAMAYGQGQKAISLPQEKISSVLEPAPSQPLADPKATMLRALREPVDAPPLAGWARPGGKVVVIANDVTRLARSEAFLPLMLDELNLAGIPDREVQVVFSNGSHRAHTPEEQRMLVGEETARRVALFDHDCRDHANLVELGITSRGTRVLINKRVVQADRVILTGSVVHHYFAGFGGGRKAILPGVSAYETLCQNHSWMLDPHARAGKMDGNPVHEDMMEAMKMVRPPYLFNVVLNEQKEFVGVFAGDYDKAHRECCRLVDQIYGVTVSAKADLAIVSCGGHPKDINMYQSHKTLENAARAVRPGGVIVLFAACPDGPGSDLFYKWMREFGSLQRIEEELRKGFVLGGHKAYAVARLLAQAKTILVSDMPDPMVRELLMTPAHSGEEALRLAYDYLGTQDASICLMPHGSLTFPLG
ncbi:MAG: nickel-dependent lactate racemase [Chloroflexota bacterium]